MPALVSPRERAVRMARYFTAVLRRWFWLLALCLLLGGVGAYIGSKLIPPTYRATTLLVVGQQTSGSDLYNSVLASTQLIPTYMSLMVQPVVLQRAASDVGGITPQQLASQIHITDQAGTQIIELDVDDNSPVRAARLANAIANTFITLQQQTMAATLAQQQQQADQQLAQVSATVNALTAQINTIRGQNTSDPRLPGLQQQLSVAQARQSTLQNESAQLAAQAITATNTIRVFQAATPPLLPDHPKPLQNAAIGAALGLIIAGILVWLLEFFNSSIRTPDEAEALLDLPVVGLVGLYPRPALLVKTSSGRKLNRKLNADVHALAATLELAHVIEPARSIAITSATAGEGRTTLAINLAIALAHQGKRVLLVDSDFHQAARYDWRGQTWWPFSRSDDSHIDIQALLESPDDLPNPFGLSVVLTRQVYQTTSMPTVSSVPGLCILPAGPSLTDTSTLFRSNRIHHFLQWQLDNPAGGRFDVVVFDTPPADVYPDAALLARCVTTTLLVVDARHSDEKAALRAKDRLERAHASITGVVLNRAAAPLRRARVVEAPSAPHAEEPLDLHDFQNGHPALEDSASAFAAGEAKIGRMEDESTR